MAFEMVTDFFEIAKGIVVSLYVTPLSKEKGRLAALAARLFCQGFGPPPRPRVDRKPE